MEIEGFGCFFISLSERVGLFGYLRCDIGSLKIIFRFIFVFFKMVVI